MPATLLKLGPFEEQGLAKLLAYAKANPQSAEQLQAIIAGDRPPIGDYMEHQFIWPIGFRCVFSYEHQPHLGLCRHLSVSVHGTSMKITDERPVPQVPAPHVMNAIGDAFGFRAGILPHFWTDETTMSLNMVQQVAKCEECEGLGLTDNHVTGEIECGACQGSGYKW